MHKALTILFLVFSLVIQANEVINLNGVKSKDISRLFDGDLTTSFNVNNVSEPLAFPYESYLILDSIKNITQFSYYTGNSSQTQGFTVRFLDLNRKQVGSYITTPTVGKYRQWTAINVDFKGVMFVVFESIDPAIQWDGINEVSIIGNNLSNAPSIYPTKYNFIPVDLGVYAHGVNILGDRINKVYNGDTILKKVAKAARFYWTGTDFDIYPQSYFGRLKDAPLNLGRYGFNHSGNLLNTFRRWDIKPMMTKSGGSIKNLPEAEASLNNSYLGSPQKKYIESGSNPEIDSSWVGLANQYQL